MTETKVLPRKIVEQLNPETNEYATEDVIVDGYRLQLVGEWDGLPASEIDDVKKFMKDVSPYLATLVGEAHALLKALRKKKRLSERQMDRLLAPGVYFSRMVEDDVVYHIRLTWDNVVFLEREEGIWVRTEEYARPGERVTSGGRSFASFHGQKGGGRYPRHTLPVTLSLWRLSTISSTSKRQWGTNLKNSSWKIVLDGGNTI